VFSATEATLENNKDQLSVRHILNQHSPTFATKDLKSVTNT